MNPAFLPRLLRTAALVTVAAVLLPSTSRAAEKETSPLAALTPFLSANCYDCHDDTTDKGGLNLLDLEFAPDQHANFTVWERVFDRVRTGEMPPKKEPRPEAEPMAAFLENLKAPLLAADRQDKAERGRVQVRRLTRREYEHTLHDLLGVDMPLQELLPEDPVTYGFETVSAGQQLSHYNLGQYLEVADLVLNDAFERATNGEKTFTKTFLPEQLGKRKAGNFRGPEIRDGVSIAWPIRLQFYGQLPATTVPESGWYRVTLKDVLAINPNHDAVWGTLRSGTCSSSSPLLFPIGLVEATREKRDLTFDAWIRQGHMLELKPNDATMKVAPTGAKGGNVGYQGRDLKKQGFQGISVTAIKMERIYPNSTRWQLRKNLFAGLTKEDVAKLGSKEERQAILGRVIRDFATLAFRRPVTAEQIAPYVSLGLAALAEPDSRPADALRAAYRGILCSPRFLTFVEKVGPLDDHAVASRLSYALWNSMPDAELRQLADAGKLRDPKTLHTQIDRLLDHPRAQRFVASFTDQWLNLKEIDFTAPDVKLYRTFDTVVQDSMVAETRAFVSELILGNRPVTQLISSDFGMINERLARFYGMKDLPIKAGAGLQRVSLPADSRSGLVTQGAVLKVSANGTTTSPVVRGVWVGERILGLEIPPPPANVPAIEPDIRGAVSIRDQLDKHRNSESCAACHVKIDPAGFALESFDPVGLWRQKYGTAKNAAAVDPSGITPEGDPFKNINGWKAIYLKKPEQLTEAFARHFLTYATGAEPRFSDRQAIDEMVATAAKDHYGMRSILHAVLTSDIFQSK